MTYLKKSMAHRLYRKYLSIFICLFLFGFYSLVYLFFLQKSPNENFPQLRVRLGTILWDSGNNNLKNGELHTYCYYPPSSITYQNKGGEYIIKRVDNFKDCEGWYGVTEALEGSWVSEREKLWWSEEQFLKETG